MSLLNDETVMALTESGWATLSNFFPPQLITGLDDDLDAHVGGNGMRQAGIGRGGNAAHVRTDGTLWLDGSSLVQRDYLTLMEDLRLTLNRALYLGLFDYESHYAVYAPGGFYRKHRDSLHGRRNRIVSCVTYLTPDWMPADEGELVLYDQNDEDREIARILPEAGTLALFLSEEIPHEVLPPRRERRSIAGWFRCNTSGAGRADSAG